MDYATLDWPFFTDAHRELATSLQTWADKELVGRESAPPALPHESHDDVGASCRALVTQLGKAGWLRYAVPAEYGGVHDELDVRSLCIVRETLARVSGLADFSFAMQGLGAGPITLFGSQQLEERYLRGVGEGTTIAAFAISEADAGSDVAAMRTTARLQGTEYVIDGEKTWISNAGIADFYVVFCKVGGADTGRPDTPQKFVALVVEPGDPGFSVTERIDTIAPHPLGTLRFENCRVSEDRLVGQEDKGLKVALATLDVFRSTVGAAAVGFARRALDEALAYVTTRKIRGQQLHEYQLTQARIAQMATAIDASALLVYRAAWTRDNGAPRVTREAAMAKMYATESAQRVIDDAVQLLGGRGVVAGHPVEQLYREIRSLRIYEGTSEIQQLVIAGQVLDAYTKREAGHD